MRLIDADAFKENIKCVCDAGGWLEPVTTAIKEYICKQVDYQTTVEVVEAIKCKDCVHNMDGFCEMVNHHTGYVSTCADVLRAIKRGDG